MSTCQGAPAPHFCEHGDRCDWTPPTMAIELPPRHGRGSIVETVSRRLAERKVRTPERALAEIEKLSTADLTPIGTTVFVWPKPVGRVTGFAVACEEHGPMPVLAPSKSAGELAAKRHIAHEHGRAGAVVHTPKAPRLKIGVAS